MQVSGTRWYQALRIAFGVLAIAAIVTQFSIGLDKPGFKPWNFFSFFTIQSNILAALVLLLTAARTLSGWAVSNRQDLVRGAAVAYMATTGIVYDVLLADIQADLQLTEPWVDWVLHRLMPLVMAADGLLVPPSRALRVRACLVWMAYPLLYLVYSLIRGPIVDWYPYPFLDPDEAGGYAGVAAVSIGIAILFAGLIWLVVTLGNRARSWWSRRQPVIETGDLNRAPSR